MEKKPKNQQKETQYYCYNCGSFYFFDEKGAYTCPNCNGMLLEVLNNKK